MVVFMKQLCVYIQISETEKLQMSCIKIINTWEIHKISISILMLLTSYATYLYNDYLIAEKEKL